MKTIIAPTDFSGISVNAVKYAASLAMLTGNSLTLFHVYPLQVAISEVPSPDYTLKDLSATAESRMEELRDQITTYTGGRLSIHTVVRQGNIRSELEQYCESIDPYAVVMGAESAGKFERFLFGGSTIAAIKQLSWPVIIVPPDTEFTGIRKIGLACDFINVPETIPMKEIRYLVSNFNAELHVLHAGTRSDGSFSDEVIEGSEWLQELLEGLKPKYHFIKGNDIEKSIPEFAKNNHIDLLILIPKKHSLVHKVMHRSQSKKIVLYAHVPVMSVHE